MWAELMEANAFGATELIHALLQLMKTRTGDEQFTLQKLAMLRELHPESTSD